MQNKRINITAIFHGLLCLSALLVSACGGSSGESASPYETYQVSADPTSGVGNVHPLLLDVSGSCVASGTGSCNSHSGVTRYSQASGFVGQVFGLQNEQVYGFELDPLQSTLTLSNYSGPVATYSAKHHPVAVASELYTYFVFSGPVVADNGNNVLAVDSTGETVSSTLFYREDGRSNSIGTFVARYNHQSGRVSVPLLLHVKNTDDPHDNAVINFDSRGDLYVMVAGRSVRRSSLLFYIRQPDAEPRFSADTLDIRDISPDNPDYRQYAPAGFSAPPVAPVSYPQLLTTESGLKLIFTLYCHGDKANQCDKGTRQLWAASLDFDAQTDSKARITEPVPLVAFGGHYAMARVAENQRDIFVAFNYHPNGNINNRTNLYMLHSADAGGTWQAFFDQDPVTDTPVTPIVSAAGLQRLAVKTYHQQDDQITDRIYLKDLLLTNQNGTLSPAILFTRSRGANSHPPTLAPAHALMLSYFSEQGWRTKTVTTEVDHNYSSGFLQSSGADRLRVVFPATTAENANALAGGVPAELELQLPDGRSATDYFADARQPGINGYLSELCEINYIRAVTGQAHTGFSGIAGAANPYRFEPLQTNRNLPAAPLMIVDGAGNWFRLPMLSGEPDNNDEMALFALEQGRELDCGFGE